MAYGLNDRVREQVSAFAGGTGAVTLPVVAVSGFQTFLSGWGASGTGEYCLVIGAQWETGIGTLNAGGTTLTRTITYNGSSGAGVAVNFSAGTMDCFGDIPAELAQHLNIREITVSSATTTDIGAVAGSNIVVSGTTTITGFGTKANRRRYVRFSGALTLTHNATSLILPGAANIITIAGDTAIFQSDASGNWRCVLYVSATYAPFAGKMIKKTSYMGNGTATWTKAAGTKKVFASVRGAGGGGGGCSNAATYQGSGGGGQGGRSEKLITTAGTTETVTVGAGGTAGANTGGTGGTGGTSSFGTHCTAAGGVGGTGATSSGNFNGGLGGVGASGDENYRGQAGSAGGSTNGSILLPGVGGGEGGGASVVGLTGVAGLNGGGGGGVGTGGGTGYPGGAGGDGYVIVWEFE